MKNLRVIPVFLSILMILVVACAQEPAPPVPEPEAKPVQTQTTPSQPSTPAQTAKTVSVSIKGFKFTPSDVIVNVGDTIVWTNEDTAPHTVESSDGTLRSDELAKGDSFSYKFTKAAKYSYICGIHPSMHGSVTVQ